MLILSISTILWTVAILLSVAYLTLLERQLLGVGQRRLGPDTVGIAGTLQPIADAVKLLTKQTSSTLTSDWSIFYMAPAWALIITLLGWSVISRLFQSTYSHSLFSVSLDNTLWSYGWLTLLAILSLTIYSALLLGWAANSSYSLVGSLRSSSALISYELILATAGLVPIIVAQSYSLSNVIESQLIVKNFWLLSPVFILFLIAVLAETSRVPFDLTEAESELVSGNMTEHASVAFVLLFLTEYASILLFSIINAVLWFGSDVYSGIILAGYLILSLIILARAVLPRIRYDQLISVCWLDLLPIAFGLIILVPSLRFVITQC